MKAKASSHFGKELQRNFLRYARKKGQKLNEALQIIIDKQHPEAVHEFRKTTRDLQSILAVCGIRHSSRKIKRLRDALRDRRHALSDWRDSDVLLGLIKQQRSTHNIQERAAWSTIADRITRQRQRTLKRFVKKADPRKLKKLTIETRAVVKKKMRTDPLMNDLAQVLQQSWQKWNVAIDAFDAKPQITKLHDIRIKAKTLRYAMELRQQFYASPQLEQASGWLKEIQDQIGAWHDELTLSQLARNSFAKPPREPHAAKLIRSIKEQEIAMAETAQKYLRSLRETDEYQRLRRLLSASIFAMAGDQLAESPLRENITGPLH
jgi:CHAD domain-containing protein